MSKANPKICETVYDLEFALSFVTDECRLAEPVSVNYEMLGDEGVMRVTSPPPVELHRVREISCDGCRPGAEWSVKLFLDKDKALAYRDQLIAESNQRNPKHPFSNEPERVGTETGYCNWQFGLMVVLDQLDMH